MGSGAEGPSRRWLAGAMLAAGAWPAGAQAQGLVRRGGGSLLPPEPTSPEADYVPPTSLAMVADIYKRMTASVRVNGRGPYQFVVDTGANQSVLASELAQQIGLTIGPVEALHGVAGVQMAATTTADLTIGGRVQQNAPLSLLPQAAIGGVGLLGLDRLESQRVTLNFKTRSLRIEPSRGAFHDPDDRVLKATKRDGQLTLVDADVAGIPVTAFIDSGAQSTIGNRALQKFAVGLHPETSTSKTVVISATGQTAPAEMAELARLRVGGLVLPNWPVAFADLHTFQLWRLTDKPAILLGVDILSRFEYVALDFPRDEVRFRLPGRGYN
jgi:predicted aspartyl protease